VPYRLEKKYKAAKPFVDLIATAAMRGGSRYVRSVAYMLAEAVRDMIEYQFNLRPPISDQWRQWKETHGFDARTLVMTGEYKNSIGVIESGGPKKSSGLRAGTYTISVGLPRRAHKRAGVALVQLAKWLEYGTKHMPERPHWRAVWDRFRIRIPRSAEQIRIETLRELHALEHGVTKRVKGR